MRASVFMSVSFDESLCTVGKAKVGNNRRKLIKGDLQSSHYCDGLFCGEIKSQVYVRPIMLLT